MSKEKSYLKLTNKIKIYLSSLTYSYFRIEVITGGCAGFQYHFTISDKSDEDIVINKEYKIITDTTSINYLKDCIIDYKDDMFNKSIQVINPNFNNTCGCGVSFS